MTNLRELKDFLESQIGGPSWPQIDPLVGIALVDRIKRLEEALKPFAKAADIWDQHGEYSRADDNTFAEVTVGDLRRARTELEPKP